MSDALAKQNSLLCKNFAKSAKVKKLFIYSKM